MENGKTFCFLAHVKSEPQNQWRESASTLDAEIGQSRTKHFVYECPNLVQQPERAGRVQPPAAGAYRSAKGDKLALLIYRMLKFGRDYVDIGQQRYEQQFKERTMKSLARKAKELGFQLVPNAHEQAVP